MAAERNVTVTIKPKIVAATGGDAIAQAFRAPTTAGRSVGGGGDSGAKYTNIAGAQETISKDVASSARKSFGDFMESVNDGLAKIQLAMDPETLHDTAQAQLAMSAATKQYEDALEKAKGKQLGLAGGFRQGLTGGNGPVTLGGIGQAAGRAMAGGGGFLGAAQAGLAAAGPLGMAAGAGLNMAIGGVAQASPQTAANLDRAMNDLSATLGKSLIPVFESLTDVVRLGADLLTPIMGPLAQAFAYLLVPLKVFTSLLSEAFGVTGKSVGAAGGTASYTGLAERGANASVEALSMGAASESHLASINGMVSEILAWLRTPASYQVAKTATELNPAWWLGTAIGNAIAH